MAWRPHGRARVSARDPRAFGICDRCNFQYNLQSLTWQFEWQGAQLQNRRILVCPICLDVPQENLRSIVLPPDPVPVLNPRPPRVPGEAGPTPPPPTAASLLLITNGGTSHLLIDDDDDRLIVVP